MRNNIISIVVACDNHYVILLAALLKSVEENHVSGEHIDVYIVTDKISDMNKTKLCSTVTPGKISLQWIEIKDAVPKNMSFPLVPNSYPLNTYIRLFIPYFLPQHIKKVLFMDVDMIVQEDISRLWHIQIGDYIIGAVTDSITKVVSNWQDGGIDNYEELMLPADTKYFNAGLQIINIPKWRENNCTEKVINAIKDNARYARMGDQYGLNVVFKGEYYELDPLWNYMSEGDHPAPYLIHFIHRKPIYKSYFNNPDYQKTFYEYLAKTEWKNARPIGESKRYLKKINNVMEKANLFFRTAMPRFINNPHKTHYETS